MQIGDKVFAVVLNNGTVQCITPHLSSANRAIEVDNYRGTKGDTALEEVVVVKATSPKKLEWAVVDPSGKYPEVPCVTRAEARAVRNFDKLGGVDTYIERREYLLINNKKVS